MDACLDHEAVMVQIPKLSKDHCDVNSCHPIAVASLYNILEHVNGSFTWQLESYGLLFIFQCSLIIKDQV